MKKQWILAAAFLLFLVALPLISIGTMQDSPALWVAGLVLLVVAGVLPPATRPLGNDDKDDKDDKDDEPEGGEGGRDRGVKREAARPHRADAGTSGGGAPPREGEPRRVQTQKRKADEAERK